MLLRLILCPCQGILDKGEIVIFIKDRTGIEKAYKECAEEITGLHKKTDFSAWDISVGRTGSIVAQIDVLLLDRSKASVLTNTHLYECTVSPVKCKY